MVTELQKRTIQAIINIFETSSTGKYDAIGLTPGDSGRLSYGRSQVSLGSGNLFKLIQQYCRAPGCQFGAQLSPFLTSLAQQAASVDHDQAFRGLLQAAGNDPVMQATQDSFFDEGYWFPSLASAGRQGISTALGIAVIYDSHVQGFWDDMCDATNAQGRAQTVGEHTWVRTFMEVRRNWLLSKGGGLATSSYRMDELKKLAAAENWELALPFIVREIAVNATSIGATAAAVGTGSTGGTGTSRFSGGPHQGLTPAVLPPHSGLMLQGSFGTKGDFEVVVPHPAGGLAHVARRNDDVNLAWTTPARFGQGDGVFSAASMLQSGFSSGSNKGNLEVVARVGGQLATYWREDVPPFTWHGPFMVPGTAIQSLAGNPAMIQGGAESKGNFEMVAPRADGGFTHYWRDNSKQAPVWSRSVDVGRADGVFEALAMIQTLTGALEVVARRNDGVLLQYTRDASMPLAWHGPFVVPLAGLAPGVRPVGVPALIQGRFGTNGNYELVTPLSSGGLGHAGRINDTALTPWTGVTVFATDAGMVDAVGLVQSNFGAPTLGSLELVALSGGRGRHYWRADAAPFAWSAAGAVVFELL